MDEWERTEMARWGVPTAGPDGTGRIADGAGAEPAAPRIVALTKVDLPRRTDFVGDAVPTSAVTGAGIGALREAIHRCALDQYRSASSVVASTSARCQQGLRQASESLERAGAVAARGEGDELVAAELRWALDELGQVVGAVYTDDILDRVFSRFCIGK